jgi:hypothetical protein
MFCHIIIFLRPVQQCCRASCCSSHDLTNFRGPLRTYALPRSWPSWKVLVGDVSVGSFGTNGGCEPRLLGSLKAGLQPATLESDAVVSYTMVARRHGAHYHQRDVHEGCTSIYIHARLCNGDSARRVPDTQNPLAALHANGVADHQGMRQDVRWHRIEELI